MSITFTGYKHNLNVSNSNAGRILHALDIKFDYTGEYNSKDLVKSCCAYLLLHKSSEDYYLWNRISTLKKLASTAVAAEVEMVYWS